MKLTGIMNMYKEMKSENETYSFFEIGYKGLTFEFLFDTNDSPFKLIIHLPIYLERRNRTLDR